MSVSSYFTNLSNIPKRQRNISCDIKPAVCPEWAGFCVYSASSEYSKNSSGSSNSSASGRSDLADMKSLTSSSSSISVCKNVLMQTPEKDMKCIENEKRSTPRKPLKPTKSANKLDPSFRGVTLQMKTSVKRRKHDIETQLVIRSYFTEKKKRTSSEKPRCRGPLVDSRLRPSSLELRFQQTSESESFDRDDMKENCNELGCRPLHLAVSEVKKECASCGTVKTPLWRDAEDGTPLCNACGIRYKKYRVRCFRCWYIPKKEEKASSCKSCGDLLRLPVSRRGNIFGRL